MRLKAIIFAAVLAGIATPSLAAPPSSGTKPQAVAALQDGEGRRAARQQGRQDERRAERRESRDREARDRVRQGDILPLPQVLGPIGQRTPGRLLDAGLELAGDRPVYRVRWAAADGRRIDYHVDARSGAVLRADGE